MTTDALKPSTLFNLRERARFTLAVGAVVDAIEWVAYDDGQLLDVIPAAQFDAPTVEDDYSRWCSCTNTAPRKVYLFAGQLLGLDVYLSGAEGTVRQPDPEDV